MYVYNGYGLDANLLTTTGAYVNSNNMDNMPNVDGNNKGAWGTLVHIESSYKVQIYCGGTSGVHGYWIRFRTGSAWHPWYKITGTEV